MKRTYTHPKTRRALLLVDLQKDFPADDGRMPVARNQVEPMIAAAAKAMEVARSQQDAVIFIGNEFRPTDSLMNFLRRNASIRGSDGSFSDERLPAEASSYFPKWAASAFVNPGLDERLKADGIGEIVLAGLKASACITATAVERLRKGYRVPVLRDATADSSDRSRIRTLRRLERRGTERRNDYPTLPSSDVGSRMNRKSAIQDSPSSGFEARQARPLLSAGGKN